MKTKFLMSAVLVLAIPFLQLLHAESRSNSEKRRLSTAMPPWPRRQKFPRKLSRLPRRQIQTLRLYKNRLQHQRRVPPLANDIVAEDQIVKSDSVLVNMVVAMTQARVAIFTDENGQPGTVLGYVAVPAGTSNDIKVTINSKKATDKMIAMLTIDAGTIGTFEYPSPDVPVKNAFVKSDVMAIFNRLSATSN